MIDIHEYNVKKKSQLLINGQGDPIVSSLPLRDQTYMYVWLNSLRQHY